ncbi:hypothetical protein TrST_g12526 [Triparma strigata]|uniref:SET domain-containing protein n=1 Tax=Triparma strigata TaxID=1606541 RepID=A0A9W7B9G2_9STRA|nr:hypothetical protein TrST_g12526 [Triparma strigata]
MLTGLSPCDHCGQHTSNFCSRCRKTTFCCADCQKLSWPDHKLVCSPRVFICNSPTAGQTVFASVDVNKSSIIIAEKPLLRSSEIQFDDLCKVLDDLPASKLNAFFNFADVYSGGVTVDEAGKCIREMEVRRRRGKNPDATAERIEVERMFNVQQSCVGILRTNTIPIAASSPGTEDEHGLYSILCRINHSCFPNSIYSWRPDLQKHVLVAIQDITAGDEIFVSYIDVWFGRDERQRRLREGFMFDCKCARCEGLDGDVNSHRATAFRTVEAIYASSEPSAPLASAMGLVDAIEIVINSGISTPFNLKQLHADAQYFFGQAGKEEEELYHRSQVLAYENIIIGV